MLILLFFNYKLGKTLKLWTNRTDYIYPKSYVYPVFTTTIAVDPEKTSGKYFCQLAYFYFSPGTEFQESSDSSVWNTNKSTGLSLGMTLCMISTIISAFFAYL